MTDDLGLLIDLSHLISFPVEPTATNNVWGDSLDPLLDRSGSDGQSALCQIVSAEEGLLSKTFLSPVYVQVRAPLQAPSTGLTCTHMRTEELLRAHLSAF